MIEFLIFLHPLNNVAFTGAEEGWGTLPAGGTLPPTVPLLYVPPMAPLPSVPLMHPFSLCPGTFPSVICDPRGCSFPLCL